MPGTATIGWINQTDPDVQAFFNATGLSDDTQKSAISQLVLDLKSNSLWTKFNAIYPFVGGTASTHKFNLKDPRDLDAAFRLSFVGGWTHSATGGLPNGTTGYADTFLVPNTAQSLDDAHFSYYSRTSTAGATRNEIGTNDGTNFSILRFRSAANQTAWGINANSAVTDANSDSAKYMIVSRTGASLTGLYINGVDQGGSVASSGKSTLAFVLGARRTTGPTIDQFSDRECAFATIGTGLTSGEASSLYTIIQAYQTTLGRQV